MMKKKNTLWYLRDKGVVSGPFPNSIITNHLVLGRLCMQDEVSSDKHNWHRIIDFEELHPQLDNNKNKEKLKRRLDERTGFDRREIQAASAENGQVRKQERRLAEPDNLIQSRQSRSLLMKKFRAKKTDIHRAIDTHFFNLSCDYYPCRVVSYSFARSLA